MKRAWLSIGILLFASSAGAQELDPLDVGLVEPVALKPLSEDLHSRYFSEKPRKFMSDPQRLLNSRDLRARNDFLNYHSSDSEIDLWFYLFKGDQEVSVKSLGIAEKFFDEEKPSAIVFYYMGQPERSELMVSPSLEEVVPLLERARAIESAVQQSKDDALVVKQLEKFMLQMSIRTYWMEQSLQAENDGILTQEETAEAEAVKEAQKSALQIWWEAYQPQFWYALGAVVLILLSVVLRAVLVARAAFRFPEIEVEPRLGGGDAAGVGAVISFASASVSPAAQRHQAPDYLKRL